MGKRYIETAREAVAKKATLQQKVRVYSVCDLEQKYCNIEPGMIGTIVKYADADGAYIVEFGKQLVVYDELFNRFNKELQDSLERYNCTKTQWMMGYAQLEVIE